LKYSGLELRRKEDPRFISGHGNFVDDIKLPNMLYAAFARSHLAHARIKNVDLSQARSIPGVELILIGRDSKYTALRPHITNMKQYVRYALAKDFVTYEGEALAVVVAKDRYTAEDAAEAIQVDYEPLPTITDAFEAMKKESPRVHEDWSDNLFVHYNHDFGEADRALAEQSDIVFSESFRSARYTGSPIEPRSMVSSYDTYASTLLVYVSTQMAHGYRSITAELLGIPENRVRVITPDVGGAFGVKTAGTPEDVIICALSTELGRPIKWTETRTEEFLSLNHCHEIVHEVRAGFSKTGKLIALKTKIVADAGSYVTLGGFEPVTHSWYYLPGQYKIPNYSVDVSCVATNKGPFGAVRGFGRVVGAFVIERVMDIAARKLGIDPAEIRYRNLVTPSDFPYHAPTGMFLDKNSFLECLNKTVETFDYDWWRKEQARLRKMHRYVGIGLASALGPSGLSASKSQGLPGFEQVRIAMDPEGKVTLFTGVCSHGQGHETVLAQLAADEIGINIEDVTVSFGDTSSAPYGFGTWSDRSAVAAGTASVIASRKLKEKLLRIGAHMLGLSDEEVKLLDGKIVNKSDYSVSKSLAEVARAAYYRTDQLPSGMEPSLETIGIFDPPNVIPQDQTGRRNESPTYSNSSHMAVVEVDPENGQVKLLKYGLVHDSGFLINPAIVDGIIQGCVAQGVGTALFEQLSYTSDGQLASSTFTDYLIPTAETMPPIELLHLETPSPSTVFGLRGAGQSGSMATPAAIANAVEDAISPFGGKVNELPLTQERVWRIIQSVSL
jgi:aerobic carbon-monoxide dehydrogenase large subunit